MVLNRGDGRFTDEERDLLDAVQPFLAAGYQAARRRSLGERFETLAMADGWAVLVVDDRGTLERASGFFGDHPVFEPSEPLPEPLLGWFESLDPDRQPWGRNRPTEAVELVLPGGAPVQVRAVFGAVPPHVVLIKVPAESNPITRLTALGLSAREAEVAVALGTGGTNRQIARQLGIAEGTIRKHLQRIYEHLGVDNRAAAVAAILRATLSQETMAS